MLPEVLRCEGLTKVYRRSKVEALSDVSLTIKGNEVFTLLGRNGAGKTTFLRIAATQLLPTKGEIFVLGYDVVKEAKEVRKRIAVIPQEAHTIAPFTPWDHVYLTLLVRGFSRSEANERTKEALDRLDLLDKKDVPADKLSGGLRQRILVAMAIATDATVLFLDEPTLGLDALNRRKVWTTIREYCREGRTIVLTTHYLDEAEALSDHVAVMERGRIRASGTIDELKSLVKRKVRVDVPYGFTPEEASSFGKIRKIADRLRVFTDERGAEELLRIALAKGVKATVSPITLEDVFVDLLEERGE